MQLPTGRAGLPDGVTRVLAFVALARGPVDRRVAAGSLWQDSDDARAAGNLRSALWRLRAAGPDMLEVDATSLRLRPGITVDVDLVSDWAARLISGRPAATDLRLVDWPSDTVDLLPGWYDDWVVFERERLRQRLLHAFEALSRALLADGRCAEAVEVAMAAVGADPLRESAVLALVEALLAEGNRHDVRQTYQAFRQRLLIELGVEPGDRLRRLVDGQAGSAPAAAPHAASPQRTSVAR